MKTFRFIGLALFAIILSACSSGGDDPIEPTPKPEVTKSEITIDSSIISNGLSFSNVGGDQSISFTTNENWTLSVASTTSGATWCTASATSGSKGTANVKFTVTENTDYDNRSVSVTIKSGTASKTFTITQKSADALLVTTDKYEVSQEGGTIEIEVKANIDYQMEIAETAKSWITESSSRGLSSYKHSLNIATNEEVDKREGEIYFKSGDKVETVKVYQTGAGAVILLSKKEYFASSAGETITVELRSNCEYEVEMPNVDWIRNAEASRAMSSHTLKYEVLPNETYESREAIIIYKETNGTIADTLSITQAQKDAILLTQKEIEVNYTGGAIEVKLESNIDYEIIMPEEKWISESSSRALVAYSKTYHIDENTAKESRSCKIIYQNTTKNIADTLTVTQKGKSNYLHFDTDEPVIWSCYGGYKKINIFSDMAYELSRVENVDWIEWISNEGTGIGVQLLDNYSVKPRSTKLAISSRNQTYTDTLTIVQEGQKGIELSTGDLNIDYLGDTIIFTVDANIEYEVIEPKSDWINFETIAMHEDKITNVKSSTHRLIVSPLNSSEDNRTEQIHFNDFVEINHDYDKTLTIKQFKKIGNSYTMEELYRLDNITELEELSIKGEIDRADFNVLRRLAGGDVFYYYYSNSVLGIYYETKKTYYGKLKKLDLSKATIVKKDIYPGSVDKKTQINWQDANTLDYYHLSNTKLETIVLPENLIRINWNTFYGCSELKNVIFGGEIRYILNGAFEGCAKLKQITFPQKLRFEYNDGRDNMRYQATSDGSVNFFKGCSELVDITFLGDFNWTNEAIKEFNYNKDFTLFGDTKLTNLTINGNCYNIPPYAFYLCENLKGELVFNGVKSLGKQAFLGCTNISNITFKDSQFTTIENNTFAYCKKLTSFEVPTSVKTIGSDAFDSCSSLETISISENVVSVGARAFIGCDNLKVIKCYPTTPPQIESRKYNDNTVLYVPKGYLEVYEKSQWGLNFKTIKEMEE